MYFPFVLGLCLNCSCSSKINDFACKCEKGSKVPDKRLYWFGNAERVSKNGFLFEMLKVFQKSEPLVG